MKVVDLSGRQHPWPPTGHEVFLDDLRPRSQYHLRCRDLLRKLYPTYKILEEVTIPGESLYIDFYLHFRRIAIEVNGSQHYEYNAFFHGDKIKFHKAKANDRRKAEWCQINNIRLVYLDWNQNDDEWTKLITDA